MKKIRQIITQIYYCNLSRVVRRCVIRTRLQHLSHPMLSLSQITFGSKALFHGVLVVVDAYTRDNDGPHTIHVRFACDDRRTTFPVTPDQLEPFSSPDNATQH